MLDLLGIRFIEDYEKYEVYLSELYGLAARGSTRERRCFFVSIACASDICGLLDDFHTRYVVLGRDLEDQVVTESTRTQRLMFPRVPPARSGDVVVSVVCGG